MRKVYMYVSEGGRNEIEELLNKSHPKIRKKFNYLLEHIKNEKNMLCEPYVKHFGVEKYKLLYELRLRTAGRMVRFIYYEADNNIILLHAFYKHDEKDTQRALEQALKILNNIKDKALYPTERLVEVNYSEERKS